MKQIGRAIENYTVQMNHICRLGGAALISVEIRLRRDVSPNIQPSRISTEISAALP